MSIMGSGSVGGFTAATTPSSWEPHIDALHDALLRLDHLSAQEVLVGCGGEPVGLQALEEVVVPALERVGQQWERGEVALSQVYMSGRMCARLIDSGGQGDRPLRAQQPVIGIGVLRDGHILGKQIVTHLLQAAGYSIIDLGARLSVQEMVEAVVESRIEVLLVSVLMLPSALAVRELREQLLAAGVHPILVVGGAPFRFDRQLYATVGADFGGYSASDCLGVLAEIERRRRVGV